MREVSSPIYQCKGWFPHSVLFGPARKKKNSPLRKAKKTAPQHSQPIPNQLPYSEPRLFSMEIWLLLLRFITGPWIQERANGSCIKIRIHVGWSTSLWLVLGIWCIYPMTDPWDERYIKTYIHLVDFYGKFVGLYIYRSSHGSVMGTCIYIYT